MRARDLALSLGAASLFAASLLGCSAPPPPAAPQADSSTSAAAPSPAVYRAGRVHFGGRQLAVVPFIAHPPDMDLRVQCMTNRDRARKQGQSETQLCFGETPRSAVRTLRIEESPGLGGPEAIRRLAAANDSAHFVVEPSGSIYQLLDLAYAPRREGTIQTSEIRVISGDPAAQAVLRDALTAAIEGLTVEVVAAPAAQPPETQPVPPAEAPHDR
ncbi:MAG: hypothetical protein R3F39_02835 [Myxococcota bacterium]